MRIGLARRLAIAGISLAVSALVFHAQIASTLVTRGDDLAHQNRLDRAGLMYARALLMDPQSVVASDRLSFLEIRHHRHDGYVRALEAAARGLRFHPHEPRLLLDRALAEEHLGWFAAALLDFDHLAALEPTARTFEFAARMALRIPDRQAAHRRFARVLALDGRFIMARRGLEATR